MPRQLPPLVALRAFEAVGRTGSIGAAADELCVSHSVVSRHVSNLEARLGVPLVTPRGRSIGLTESGAAYLAQITRAFDAIEWATARLAPQQAQRLDIWCIPGLANRNLLKHLNALEALLPDTEIMLQPTLSRPDFSKGEADAEIVYLYDHAPRPGLQAELIARPRVFPVASPLLRERLAPVDAPAELRSLPLIHEESTEQWDRWLEAAGAPAEAPLRGMRLWHAHLTIEAAKLGQGVALANEILVADEVATGALVELAASDVRLGGYYLIASERRWDDPDIKTLRNWLDTLFAPIGIRA